jgi:hypothetical protein
VLTPQCREGHVLIGSRRTLVSAGPERMLVGFGEAGYLERARQKPERVKKVIDKMTTDGLCLTVEVVQAKLDPRCRSDTARLESFSRPVTGSILAVEVGSK